jgi:hypothetical protein
MKLCFPFMYVFLALLYNDCWNCGWSSEMEEVERIEEEMCEEERWRSLYQVRFSQARRGTLGFKRTWHEIDSEYLTKIV